MDKKGASTEADLVEKSPADTEAKEKGNQKMRI